MNKDSFNALMLGGLLILTLPLFYLLFSKVILPTLWHEEPGTEAISPTIESSESSPPPTSSD